ncbi:MAG: Maf family protein, partial [Gammaproteobacteria bacterium]|nr:Maf family protein [Gammaproteobacteria bacterium]
LDAASGRIQSDVVPFAVKFRSLTANEIEAYVSRERAYDCAGGFRAERLGSALFECMRGDDPTALLGLPMIRLCVMLRAAGCDVLRAPGDSGAGTSAGIHQS